MGIFNMFLGGRDEQESLDRQAGEVLSALNTANREKEHAMKRMQAALDAVTLPLLLADERHVLVHANPAALRQLRLTESDLRVSLNGFTVDALVGSKLESIYPSSILQRAVFDALTAARTDNLAIGSRQVVLTMSPLFDGQRNRMGTVVEWQDQTEQEKLKQQQAAIQVVDTATDKAAVVELERLKTALDAASGSMKVIEKMAADIGAAASEGNLAKRIDAAALHGTPAVMANGINQLMHNFESFINDMSASMDALNAGKLTSKITQDYKGSFSVLKNAVNTTVVKLVDVVDEIRQGAVNVMHSTIEINSGNINLSSRTEQQAASLEETSAAMEQITTTVQQNAANAIQANNLARGARETAENGGQVVSRAVAAMQAISESSNKINDIIGVIDEIAFQTNLLALNAAVEAARAGDQGRGFAVVADEVRNLAGRSAKAAKEIKELIKDSSEKVKEGSNLVNKSGETLDEIVTAVKKVNDIVAEISTASDEQATGLDEISRAVSEMDTMTQQNAALVEQNSSAGRTLDDQASALNSVIAFFDTGHPSPLATTVARRADKPEASIRSASRPTASRMKTSARPVAKTAGPASRTSAPATVAARPKKVEVKPRSSGKADDEDKNWAEF